MLWDVFRTARAEGRLKEVKTPFAHGEVNWVEEKTLFAHGRLVLSSKWGAREDERREMKCALFVGRV